jgi:hypothetical protein
MFDTLSARWSVLGFAEPLKYGHREAHRQDLDPVVSTGGRVVMHAGAPGAEDADAGELDMQVLGAHDAAPNVATDWALFTVYCHGYDAAAPDDELAQDDAAWGLKQAFLGVLFDEKAGLGHYVRLREQVWRRSPQERRFGELIRLVFEASFGVRAAPELPTQTATPYAKATVETAGGLVTVIDQENA